MKTKTQCYKGLSEGHFYSLLKWICTGRDSWKALGLLVTRAFSSVQSSHSVMSDSFQPHRLQHVRLPCLSPNPRDAQTLVHQVGDAIQPSHPLLSPSPPAFNLSQHQGLFQWVRSWPKYWSFSFSISPSYEHSRLISFRMDWLYLLAVQGTLKSLLQHHSSEASILWCSAFFIVQLSHLYTTTGKIIALIRQTFVGKVMSLLFNICLNWS